MFVWPWLFQPVTSELLQGSNKQNDYVLIKASLCFGTAYYFLMFVFGIHTIRQSRWPLGVRLLLHWSQNRHIQQSGQTPDKETGVSHITVYVSGNSETHLTGMLSPNNGRLSGPPKSEFVSSWQSGQTLSEIRITLQYILHTIHNIIKSFYVHSIIFSELTRKFCECLAQFKIFFISSWFPKLTHPPSSSVPVLQAEVNIYHPSHHQTSTLRSYHVQ